MEGAAHPSNEIEPLHLPWPPNESFLAFFRPTDKVLQFFLGYRVAPFLASFRPPNGLFLALPISLARRVNKLLLCLSLSLSLSLSPAG